MGAIGQKGAKGAEEELAEALVAALHSGMPAALDPGKVEGTDFGCCFRSGNDLRGSPFTPGVESLLSHPLEVCHPSEAGSNPSRTIQGQGAVDTSFPPIRAESL